MKPTSGAFTMPRLSQACLLGYTPSPQQAFQGDAAHQAQRHTWLTPNGSPGTWYTRRDYRSRWTLHPFHRTVVTAHTWSALPLQEDGNNLTHQEDPMAKAVVRTLLGIGTLVGSMKVFQRC